MKPHLIEIRDFETNQSIIVDMEGPYHPVNERIGEHIYGATIYIDNIPYHFEKYIPTPEEIEKFEEDNEGKPRKAKGGYLYRIVPFSR